MSSYISNWPEVAATLLGTRWEPLLTLDGSVVPKWVRPAEANGT